MGWDGAATVPPQVRERVPETERKTIVSERFVRAWKASPKKLLSLIRTRRISAPDVVQSRANESCREDVLMTLGQGDRSEGAAIADAALTSILDARLKPDQAYAYARVTEMLLNHVAVRVANNDSSQIAMQLTYHVPNDESGRWNPILKACRLPKLAKAWGQANFPFPWSRGKPKSDWPVWTVLDPSKLDPIALELNTATKEQFRAVPDRMLSEDEDCVVDCRKELLSGLKRLRGWVEKARAPEKRVGPAWERRGNALILLMDGDR
jgi:hypothetical protein